MTMWEFPIHLKIKTCNKILSFFIFVLVLLALNVDTTFANKSSHRPLNPTVLSNRHQYHFIISGGLLNNSQYYYISHGIYSYQKESSMTRFSSIGFLKEKYDETSVNKMSVMVYNECSISFVQVFFFGIIFLPVCLDK